ncbi:MAG TPA: TonB-dependent receptor [Burkholderiaceae bacterium]|nr:TonB-dependent receptor [Burkholderiaceae bacterium]
MSNIEITSVSKRAERLSDAPTSVFVITRDDIRRSGATSLPEALRLAPNLQVARASANGWAISSRGFNSASANKLLVLIDGRSVYSPLFSGVFWDVQDLMLEDVERIEVISGPGGTLWGVNAVNGVVNVITRSSDQTQGRLLSLGAGNQEAQAALRQGGELGENGHYRIYAKQSHREHTETQDGRPVDDASHTTQIGFRTDWAHGSDKITFQGDAYNGKREQPLPGTIAISGVNLALGTISVSGGNLLARWKRRLANDASVTAQMTYDRVERTVPPTFAEKLDIVDFQIQHASRPNENHALVWGAEYRYAMDDVVNSTYVAFLPSRVNQAWASLFAQDEIAIGSALQLTLGARIESNDYTGSEFLPNVRLAWKPSANQLLWGAVSRTVRAPSRLDRDTFVPGQPPFLLTGGPDFRSEVAKVYELGYRAQPTERVSYSVTAFHADYDRLHTQELAPSQTSLFFGNGMRGTVRGVEMWGSYQATPKWRLHGGLTRLWQDFQLRPGSIDTADSVASTEGANPSRQWKLRSSLDLTRQMDLDITARYVSELALPRVPSYLAMDLRWAWRPSPRVELSVTGQNLLGPAHGEFTSELTRTAFSRAVFVELVSRF